MGHNRGNRVEDTEEKVWEITDLNGDAVGKVYGVEGSDVERYMGFYYFFLSVSSCSCCSCCAFLTCFLSVSISMSFFSFLDQGTVKTPKEGRVVVGWGDRDIW